MKNIKTKIRTYKQFVSLAGKKIFFFLIHLKFMKNKKIKISVLNRYLILFILLLFSFLFYLSTPALYDYDKLQRDLSKKLSEEFNLNASLSSEIIYKILPTPNFEISNVMLSTGSDERFDEFAQVKKIKIYILSSKLFDQNELEIKKIVLLNSNFNINKNSFKYLKEYLKEKNSTKQILVKKGNIFFKDKKHKEAIFFSSIKRSSLFYDEKNNKNKMYIHGSVFNTKFDFNFSRDLNNLGKTNTKLNFSQLNSVFKNEIINLIDNKKNLTGSTLIDILNSEVKINYNINTKDKLILFSSEKLKMKTQKIYLNGEIDFSPFYFDINVNLNNTNIVKLFDIYFQVKNLFEKSILLHENFNGKITIKINSMKNFKFFNRANVYLNFINGKLLFDDTVFISDKIGKLTFVNSQLLEQDNQNHFSAKILFKIENQKKFYQTFQILKSDRLKLKDIYIELDKKMNEDRVIVKKFELNSKNKKNLLEKHIDLTEQFSYYESKELNNWFAIKKLVNQIFKSIN